MKKPKIALVGRPNVGKSSLFNRICKKRYSIVDESEGVTRDRLYADVEVFGKSLTLIDTAGIDLHSSMSFRQEVLMQTNIAIAEADLLILVVDAVTGLLDLDRDVAKLLFKAGKPIILAVNKIDDEKREHLVHQFLQLGLKKMLGVSAVQGTQIAELLEMVLEDVTFDEEEQEEIIHTKIAIVGRTNVGKSTLINSLLKEKRSVVSDIAGTTRDSIDVAVDFQDETYTFIDTAGIRRKHSENTVVEKFAFIRTQKAIERADICLLVLDVNQGMTTQEKKIAGLIEEKGKGCILLLNKWDLAKDCRMEHALKALQEEVPFFKHIPALFISALTNRNVEKIFPQIEKLERDLKQRITTGELNKFFERAIQNYHPPMIRGKRLRIYYATQIKENPPHILLFINYPFLFTPTYKRYIVNQFRKVFSLNGVPLIIDLKTKAAMQ